MSRIPLDGLDFVVFDVETTGLEPAQGHRICEIGAIGYGNSVETGRFHSMINPQRAIPPGASAVNGITPDMVASAPTAGEMLPSFCRFIDGKVLAAYNAPFDMAFLNMELVRAGIGKWDAPVIDVLWLARRLAPGLARYGLAYVTGDLGVPHQQAHRAMGDVEATACLLMRFLPMLRKQGIETVDDLCAEQALAAAARARMMPAGRPRRS